MSYRDASGRFAKAPKAVKAATAAPAFGPFNAEQHAKELAKAIGAGDFNTVKRKVSAFINRVTPTTPLEQVVVAMLKEYCGVKEQRRHDC